MGDKMHEFYKITPFMTAEQYYINGELVFAEIPINWDIVNRGGLWRKM